MEFRVYNMGLDCGGLELSLEDGRYLARAVCAYRPGIFRLYLIGERGILPLGVLIPQGGELRLERRIGAREADAAVGSFLRAVLCEGEEQPEAAPPPEDTLPAPAPEPKSELPQGGEPFAERWLEAPAPEKLCSDPVLSAALKDCEGVLYAYSGGKVQLAVPAGCHEAAACVLCLAQPARLRGGDYFIITLNARGWPCLSPEVEIEK